MNSTSSFDFRYDRWCGWLLGAVGSGRRFSRINVTETELDVQLGPAFKAVIPRHTIRSARPWKGLVFGWGAHGWRGRWLVNGSSKGIVVLEVDPPGAGRVLGFPVKVRELALSVEDPEGFTIALGLDLNLVGDGRP